MSSHRSLRIAHVQPMSLDLFGQRDEDYGRSARYFLPNLAEAQARLGHDPSVHLLTSGRSHELRVRGLDVHFHSCAQPPSRVGLQRRFGRQLSIGLLRSLRRGSADLVHFYGLRNSQLMLALTSRRCASVGIPLVAHDQGRRFVRRLEAWAGTYALGRLAACIVSTTDALEVITASGYDRERIHVVPNGFDPRIFYPRAEPPSGHDRVRILIVSRLTPEKDPLTAARAVAMLASTVPTELTVIGEGPLGYAVERAVAGTGVGLRMLGFLPQHRLGEHYRNADLFVLTSLHETYNQSVVEAMACGVPVIATDVPGLRDVVAGVGVLVQPQDPGQLTAAVRTFVAHPERWSTYREAGLARAAGLTWDTIAAQLDRVYEQALAVTIHAEPRP